MNKFGDLSMGDWFEFGPGTEFDMFRFMKVQPIIDSWGNTIVAVSSTGTVFLDTEDVSDDSDVRPVEGP